jgi:dihydroflavonol-4-reductase
MKAAITGATGFLGSHLVSTFLAEGWSVAGLVHSQKKAQALPTGLNAIVGDICDRPALDRLVEGADVVFHTVSNFRTASGPPESYHRINVEGTRTMMEAAMAAGVRRFVHCSTIGVHGHVVVTPGDEDAPFNPGDLYQKTKLEAENLVRQYVGKSEMEIVIIRPCSMYGPGDLRMLKMFRMLSKRTFLMLGPCRENFHAVYVDDVVQGFLKAATAPDINGEVFIVGGPAYIPLKEYITQAAQAVGAPMPWLRFPYFLFYYAAVLCEAICVPFKFEPPLHRRRVRFYRNNRAYNIDKARRTLGYRPHTDLKQGMALTVDWYRENGYL